jgi:hypothetical protein
LLIVYGFFREFKGDETHLWGFVGADPHINPPPSHNNIQIKYLILKKITAPGEPQGGDPYMPAASSSRGEEIITKIKRPTVLRVSFLIERYSIMSDIRPNY